MLLLSPGRVAQGLRTGTLTETQKVRLMIAGTVVPAVLAQLSSRGFRTWADVLYFVLYIAAIAAGIWACHRANQKGDGRGFIERYVCLSVPLTIAMYLVYFSLFFGAYFVLRQRSGLGSATFARAVQPYFMLVGLALLFSYFAVLRGYIRRVAPSSAV